MCCSQREGGEITGHVNPSVVFSNSCHTFIQFTQTELQSYLYSYFTVFRQLGRTQAEICSGTGELVGVEMAMVGWKLPCVTR